MKIVVFSITLLAALCLAACDARRSEPFYGPVEIASATLQNGQQKFMQYCYKCHPMGEAGLGPAINPNPAPGFVKGWQIRLGIGVMPHFGEDKLSDQDVKDVVEYLQALKDKK